MTGDYNGQERIKQTKPVGVYSVRSIHSCPL